MLFVKVIFYDDNIPSPQMSVITEHSQRVEKCSGESGQVYRAKYNINTRSAKTNNSVVNTGNYNRIHVEFGVTRITEQGLMLFNFIEAHYIDKERVVNILDSADGNSAEIPLSLHTYTVPKDRVGEMSAAACLEKSNREWRFSDFEVTIPVEVGDIAFSTVCRMLAQKL